VGLNGSEYDKTNYDTLLSPSGFCGNGALAMGTASGASNYYSPANPQKTTGFNQYIPDSQGYPFTETEYTQDNTGRISRQSGVGPDHRLGSGHETLYYYGSPDQSELDALFGTEAGDNSHYFKNMVRDANGQYSVSYVDMHGRTIATALAGLPPATVNLDTLSSYSANTLTETLTDPNSVTIKDLVMENDKSLLVATAGTHTFSYTLNPQTLKKQDCQGDSVCYHCLYDLEITITDDCNNQKLPNGKAFDTTISNFTIGALDTTCASTKGFSVNFSLNLPEGNYEITKKLSVSAYALQYYRDSVFQKKNTCISLNQWIQQQRDLVLNSQCRPDCLSCRDSLGSWDSFRTRYMQTGGIATADTAANRGNAWAAYQDALTACNALCDSTSDGDVIMNAMLADMTAPSGQYANPDNADQYSVFYIRSNTETYTPIYQTASLIYLNSQGQPDSVFDDSTATYVSPRQLDAHQFAAKFKTSWATTLLPYHPEYCKLAEYEKHAASNLWDRKFAQVDNYVTALSSGYLNPTANTAAPFNKYTLVAANKDPLAAENSSYQTQLENKLQQYTTINGAALSMWSLATMLTECNGTDPPVSR
jgi:hypothetical protein